jgi:methanogenic corrinoid protein MtbC1
MVGGAVLTRNYALNTLKADYYAKDATEGVAIAKGIFGGWDQ